MRKPVICVVADLAEMLPPVTFVLARSYRRRSKSGFGPLMLSKSLKTLLSELTFTFIMRQNMCGFYPGTPVPGQLYCLVSRSDHLGQLRRSSEHLTKA